MKAVVAAFNQEKALVGAFSVITNLRMELFQALVTTGAVRAHTSPARHLADGLDTARRSIVFMIAADTGQVNISTSPAHNSIKLLCLTFPWSAAGTACVAVTSAAVARPGHHAGTTGDNTDNFQ